MGRFPQGPHSKGSQRWLQWLVNEAPDLLDEPIGLGPIDWRSPFRADDYAEYRNQAFLDLLDIRLPTRPLAFFWPRGGPQWDGLGRAASGELILVEAKAHLNELYSAMSARRVNPGAQAPCVVSLGSTCGSGSASCAIRLAAALLGDPLTAHGSEILH